MRQTQPTSSWIMPKVCLLSDDLILDDLIINDLVMMYRRLAPVSSH